MSPSPEAVAQAQALIDDHMFKHWAAGVLARAEGDTTA